MTLLDIFSQKIEAKGYEIMIIFCLKCQIRCWFCPFGYSFGTNKRNFLIEYKKRGEDLSIRNGEKTSHMGLVELAGVSQLEPSELK